jgi:hypothetical protein
MLQFDDVIVTFKFLQATERTRSWICGENERKEPRDKHVNQVREDVIGLM